MAAHRHASTEQGNQSNMKRLNIGCGPHFHPDWVNIDLISPDPQVIQHDLRRGLPLEDDSFDAVYHSHVLEHFHPGDAEQLLRECCRVLRPGGILRVVVPDLEAIAREYLSALEAVDNGNQQRIADLQWMTIELLDQLVRTQSGGTMRAYAHNLELGNRQFVESRIGSGLFEAPNRSQRAKHKSWSRLLDPHLLPRRVEKARQAITLAMARLIGGRRGYQALKEGYFRQSGEIHLWMYDRVSLRHLLQRIGLTDISVCSAHESRISGFSHYNLDVCAGRIRKPDSLFVEAMRPGVAEADCGETAAATRALRKSA
jgi:predicted SAM-dependent methyltransferase